MCDDSKFFSFSVQIAESMPKSMTVFYGDFGDRLAVLQENLHAVVLFKFTLSTGGQTGLRCLLFMKHGF